MAVRITSVRECILYEYAKLIADRAVEGRAGVAAFGQICADLIDLVLDWPKLSKNQLLLPHIHVARIEHCAI